MSALELNSIFVDISKQHWDLMFRFALSLVKCREEAEDLIQASLLKGMKAFPKFVEEKIGVSGTTAKIMQTLNTPSVSAHIKNWLLKILRNTWLDNANVQKRWVFESEGLMIDAFASDTLEPDYSDDEAEFYNVTLDDNLKKHFAELSPRQRSALFLFAHDYSYREIAEILDVPMGTVMSTLSRGLQKLRDLSNAGDPIAKKQDLIQVMSHQKLTTH